MTLTTRTLAAALTTLTLTVAAVDADAHGRGGRYYGPGPFWGGIGIGLGIGLGSYYYGPYGPYGRPYGPGYVIVEPAPVYRTEPQPVPAQPAPARREPAPAAVPDPIFYPRNGQSPALTEADRVECNRWATTQPSAMLDASVFQRATLACMEGRGYVVR